MISRYDVALNGQHMSDLDDNLLVLDVSYPEPSMSSNDTEFGYMDGTIPGDQYITSTSVTITFELHIYDIAEREAVRQKVVSWAKEGGTLTVNDRVGQMLECKCTQYPSVSSVKNWTDTLSITFTAFVTPYWQEVDATTVTVAGINPSANLKTPGNGGYAYVSCSVVAGGTLTSLKITVGDTYIELSNISISRGSTVSISYDSEKHIVIKSGGTSLLSKRTALSSDNLLAMSGETTRVSIITNVTATTTFSVRGCWM